MTLPWTEVALPMALALLVVFVPLLLACWLTADPDRAALRPPPRSPGGVAARHRRAGRALPEDTCPSAAMARRWRDNGAFH